MDQIEINSRPTDVGTKDAERYTVKTDEKDPMLIRHAIQ
jgi:hypothetical protein